MTSKVTAAFHRCVVSSNAFTRSLRLVHKRVSEGFKILHCLLYHIVSRARPNTTREIATRLCLTQTATSRSRPQLSQPRNGTECITAVSRPLKMPLSKSYISPHLPLFNTGTQHSRQHTLINKFSSFLIHRTKTNTNTTTQSLHPQPKCIQPPSSYQPSPP